MSIKIELTEEQQLWLLRRLNVEWDEELNYQWSNVEHDTTYMEELLEVYTAILGKPRHWIDAYSKKDEIESKLKELQELKEANK